MNGQADFTTARYWVRHVYELQTRNAGPTRYEVSLFAADAHVAHTLVTTLDQWKASLCQRAEQSHAPILVTWRKTKFGHELVSVVPTDDRPLIDRLVPHDGYFGMSGWVMCQAPTCVCPEIGISRGEKNVVDPKTNQHWHVECYEAAIVAVEGGRPQVSGEIPVAGAVGNSADDTTTAAPNLEPVR